MQRIHDRGCIRSIEFPQDSRTLAHMIDKGWIEISGEGRDRAFRITERGIAAKKARISSKRQGFGRPPVKAARP